MMTNFLLTAKHSNKKHNLREQSMTEFEVDRPAVSTEPDHTEKQDVRFRYTY